MSRIRGALLDFLQGLWFVPGAIALLYTALAVVLVEIDRHAHPAGGPLFESDAPAARTVLSVIAGSLITVAGISLSITILVLQLTSNQFSPRILRTFFGDRMTQLTVGSYVGIFTFSLVVLRSVGPSFVPRLSVTAASVLAIAAVALLVVFIHHVSQLIQVSYVTGQIAETTLARLETLYPADREPEAEDPCPPLPSGPRALVRPSEPGFLRFVDHNRLLAIGAKLERIEVLARPGDFVSADAPLVAIWPASSAAACEHAARASFRLGRERDLEDDLAFGLRQLVDTAVKAMSPGINDPTTAFTCVGYLRSILVRLAARPFPAVVVRGRSPTFVVRRREFDEYLESLAEIARYSVDDPRVTLAVLEALQAVCDAADGAGFQSRAAAAGALARDVATAAAQARANRDRLD